mgnify:CR=1 FL=1
MPISLFIYCVSLSHYFPLPSSSLCIFTSCSRRQFISLFVFVLLILSFSVSSSLLSCYCKFPLLLSLYFSVSLLSLDFLMSFITCFPVSFSHQRSFFPTFILFMSRSLIIFISLCLPVLLFRSLFVPEFTAFSSLSHHLFISLVFPISSSPYIFAFCLSASVCIFVPLCF